MGSSDAWYQDAVVYSVDVETFLDADGDGVGDFRGLHSQLDYLDSLGVDCLWLLPFYTTPNRDNGYDVADHYGVDSRLGTPGHVVEFVREAEDRGIRVIVDLVVNHTSDRHPWFQAAREDPESKYRDYYLWTDDPESAPEKGTVFPGEEENVWTYDEAADAYYYHRFYHFQPELNTANPAVREEIRDILGYWLQLGVSGFRIDAATLMIDQKGADPQALEEPHDILREMKRFVRQRRSDAVLLAEADDDPPKLASYFGGEDGPEEMDMLLNFVLNAHITHALATERAAPIARGLERLPDIPEHGRWANFLRNFDELNIGRLDEPDREAVYERFAPEPRMRIYDRGIRRRIAPMLDGDPDRIELAHSLLFSLPGTPILVSGDEIGMGEDLSLGGRNPVRTPMHWSNEPNGGFSTADEEELVRPVVDEGAFGYENVNVAAQRTNPDSLLNRMSRLIHAYKEIPEFNHGDHALLDAGDESVFAHSFVDEGESAVLSVHNLSDERRVAEFDPGVALESPFVLAGGGEAERLDDGRCRVELDGYDYCWARTTGVRRTPAADD